MTLCPQEQYELTTYNAFRLRKWEDGFNASKMRPRHMFHILGDTHRALQAVGT